MSRIENTIIARFEHAGEKFELLVDPILAFDYKTGKKKDLNNVLISDEVFKDANKGERQTEGAIKKAFGTTEIEKIAKIVFEKGELQLTTDQRRKALEEKKRKVIELIARNVVDPKTKTPHPPARIEKALDEAKFSFDAFKSAEKQMQDAVEAIRSIIPVSFEKIKIAVKIPAEYSAKCYGILKDHGISREEWASDGSLVCMCEMPAGIQSEFYDKINKATGGKVETKMIK